MGSGAATAGQRRREGAPGWLAALVAAVVGLAACTAGEDGPDARQASEAPTRTTSTTAAPPPGLQRVVGDPSVLPAPGSRFTGVVVGSRVILVIGDVDGRAAMWTIVDGAAYDPVPLPSDAFPPGSVLADVTLTRDRFVVVGSAGGASAAWTSPDGRTWTRTDHDGGTSAEVVIVGELGLTSFGRDGGALATWVSFDGSRWERVPGGAEVFPGTGPVRPVGAYDDGEGYVVVAERAGVAERWRSGDGRTWQADPATGADLLPGAGPPRPRALLGAGSTAVVLGAVDDPDGTDAAVWTSLAGAPFERATPSEAVFGGDGAQAVNAAAQLGTQLVAVGTDTDVEGDVDAVVWSTTASGAWVRSGAVAGDGFSGPGDQHAVAIAPTRRGALVVGWEELDGTTRAVTWALAEGEPAAPVPGGGPVLAWRRVPTGPELGGPGEQRLLDVAAPDGFVAVGSSASPGDPGADLDAAVWRSRDGLDWALVPDEAGALRGPGDQRLLAVVVGGPGLVAVGADGASAAVWTSPTGEAWSRVPHDEAVFGGPGDQEMADVAVAADGALVAVGRDGGAGDGDAAVWRSGPDGTSWARVAPAGDVGGEGVQALAAVAVVGDGLVAVGASGAGAVVWASADGTGWARTDLGPGRAEGVVEGPEGAVAVGSRKGAEGRGREAAAWLAGADGTWAAVEVDDGDLGLDHQEALAVAEVVDPVVGPLLAAVGRTGLGPGDDAAAWAGVAGDAWVRAPHDEDVFGGDQDQRMVAVASGGEVAVAVGWSGSEPATTDAAVWVTAPPGGGGGIL